MGQMLIIVEIVNMSLNCYRSFHFRSKQQPIKLRMKYQIQPHETSCYLSTLTAEIDSAWSTNFNFKTVHKSSLSFIIPLRIKIKIKLPFSSCSASSFFPFYSLSESMSVLTGLQFVIKERVILDSDCDSVVKADNVNE